MATPSKLAALLSWCDLNGVRIDPKIEVVCSDAAGIAARSKRGITTIGCPSTLVSIPKSAVLSVRSCTFARCITPVPYGHGAHLALALALYSELLQGQKSRWYGYLQSLPSEIVDIALFWSTYDRNPHVEHVDKEDALLAHAWIKGSEIENCMRDKESGENILEEIDTFYSTVGSPILAQLRLPISLEGFYHAYSLVSSRAFLVDAYHGLAMVPIADAFNHAQENHVHLESDYDVCVICGALDECPHDEDISDANGECLSASIEGQTPQMTGGVRNGQDTCEMVSNSPIPPSAEAFNTYGEGLSNAELLTSYGFILDDNEFDSVRWSLSDLRSLASGLGFGSRRDQSENAFGELLQLWTAIASAWPSFSEWNDSLLVYADDHLSQPSVQSLHLPWNPKTIRFTDKDKPPSSLLARDENAVDLEQYLCLNGDGKLSHHLWLWCALLALQLAGGRDVEVHDIGYLQQLANAQLEQEGMVFGRGGETMSFSDDNDGPTRRPCGVGVEPTKKRVGGDNQSVHDSNNDVAVLLPTIIGVVTALCDLRCHRVERARGMSSEELGQLLDKMPFEMRRTRMVITQVVVERSILESCMSTWKELEDVK
ncbi:hypothetical protein JAAARDRAFT_171946 [Jaapia argillacea MUCL 33604]|uniref:SET domain-containing protein n=1 Tax=Jaapia argillacea MUCL 33604 TaxID=933084 RepID=A0A067Q3H3_9AGAM|nr:hypothetical protein JAAARDRAFT_171946 [Jaapia argillacea MUCL 33604]